MMPQISAQPPVFVSGGKRLNFNRGDEFEQAVVHQTFRGYGKDDGCYPSCSWGELCAMAALIVAHPAYVSEPPIGPYPPSIEDADDGGT